MKKIRLVLLGGAAALLSAVTLAQPGGGILMMDADGDGQVSRQEFQPPGGRGGPKIFKWADADGDGSITRDEMLVAVKVSEERQAKMQARMTGMFDAMDADGDGTVSASEAQDHAFSRMDANGDGFVSEEEAKAMHDKRKGWRKRHGDEGSGQS
ncbi:EF-hand domain-containing protein [Congregibacter sp.]|uniref:EF-hand domain-containing protein n=1 Tax=Congregibacter sp. TaxID=2744308 RepID=UPI003F6B2CF9